MVSDQTVKNLAETFERSQGQPGRPADGRAQGGAGRRRRQARDAVAPRSWSSGRTAATSAPTTASSTSGCTTRPIPIAELERLLALHKLHFFPSEPQDLMPITPAIVAQLEPILLTEPANQPEKWLSRNAGVGDPDVPRGAQELHVLGELRRAGADGREDRPRRARRHSEEAEDAIMTATAAARPARRSTGPPTTPASSGIPAGSRPCSSPRCGSASATTACARSSSSS